MEPGGVVAE